MHVSSREALTPGNVVRLNEPYQVDYFMMSIPLRELGVGKPWQWEGFTHGIIAELISHKGNGDERVSLYLYHPELKLIYLNPHDGMPMHVDFAVNEFQVVQVAHAPTNLV